MGNIHVYDWVIIGAGPAGIATIGKLIDYGVEPKTIVWIDPVFQVGDLGSKWSHVLSNDYIKVFQVFLRSSDAFDYEDRPAAFPIDEMDPEAMCILQHLVEPLQWITDRLRKKVNSFQGTVTALNASRPMWEVEIHSGAIYAKNAVLAIGGEPTILDYPVHHEIVPLEAALNYEKLSKAVGSDDIVGVFGSSHSAIISLAHLCRLKVKKIINFYRSPLAYMVDLDDWTVLNRGALRGFEADWAKKNIDGTLPQNMSRIQVTDSLFSESLSQCNKVIYAVGFQARTLCVENCDLKKFDSQTGVIANRLFGIGIGFPMKQLNLSGTGVLSFIYALNKFIPAWMKSAVRP